MRCLFTFFVFLFVYIEGCECSTKSIRLIKGAPIQAQLKDCNVIYKVDGIFDLNGETITIPQNSKFEFRRNSKLMNGTVIGDNTEITGSPTFGNLRLKGSFTNKVFKASWNTPHTMSEYIADVMNLNDTTVLLVDKNISLSNSKRLVNHLNLISKGKIITNSDRFFITHGGCVIRGILFKWDKDALEEPKDNYSAVVIYSNLLLKDTIINITIENVEADGGRYCSYFMKQYKSSIHPLLRTINKVEKSKFVNFTRGAIWTCGGTGNIVKCQFRDIGYESPSALLDVTALRLGYSDYIGNQAKAIGYNVYSCTFNNIVAAYNHKNDGRGLHGLLVYGDSTVVRNNKINTLSTSFSNATETGMDAEMLYIKGSYNKIEDNTFDNGAGSSSDGVITLKIAGTKGNIVRNNTINQSANYCTFLRLGGSGHIVENNKFRNLFFENDGTLHYAIYLHHDKDSNEEETAIIINNIINLAPGANYMGIYANGRGTLEIIGNKFKNVQSLLKNNKRTGLLFFSNNTVVVEAQKTNTKDVFIQIGANEEIDAQFERNTFEFNDAKMGKFINGTNYIFNNNRVNIFNTSFESLLCGIETRIEAISNTFIPIKSNR